MPARRRTIPPKAQLPVMIGLSIVFAIILYWRFGVAKHPPIPVIAAPVATGATPINTTQANAINVSTSQTLEASIRDLRTLLAETSKDKLETPDRQTAAEPLTTDPFSEVISIPAAPMAGSGELIPVGNESTLLATSSGSPRLAPIVSLPLGPSRAERLDQLALTAVLLAGDTSVSVINNKNRCVGETISGFTLVGIDENGITLRDDTGTTRLQIRNNILLSRALEQP